ncbi:uncharacterized protein F5147DRAFT_659082 [Suillus discolor]|uniref:Uncharacterized protein n=1 Tax=Suillus discolor TaxID=1912936 RepID=A0A9P7JLS9_9AGAM|nr:uncharacterized protein F5147DRAFT_659082 [Suillus discolor]KAG2086965.1 hypothetical protein F5147DRAFT_659082 [Suillus discolor]
MTGQPRKRGHTESLLGSSEDGARKMPRSENDGSQPIRTQAGSIKGPRQKTNNTLCTAIILVWQDDINCVDANTNCHPTVAIMVIKTCSLIMNGLGFKWTPNTETLGMTAAFSRGLWTTQDESVLDPTSKLLARLRLPPTMTWGFNNPDEVIDYLVIDVDEAIDCLVVGPDIGAALAATLALLRWGATYASTPTDTGMDTRSEASSTTQDAFVHPDHPLRKGGVDGTERFLGK